MVPSPRFSPARTVGRSLGVLAAVSAGTAAIYVLFPDPLADVFFAGWVVAAVGLAVVGASAAWTNRTPLVWVSALLLTALSIAGMWSIGLFIAPAALFLLGSALLLQLAEPRTDRRKASTVAPPTTTESARKASIGAVSVVVGGWLAYTGALERELFGACARETVSCAVDGAQWDAIGVTALGLLAVGLGSWLVWEQVYIARESGSESVE